MKLRRDPELEAKYADESGVVAFVMVVCLIGEGKLTGQLSAACGLVLLAAIPVWCASAYFRYAGALLEKTLSRTPNLTPFERLRVSRSGSARTCATG